MLIIHLIFLLPVPILSLFLHLTLLTLQYLITLLFFSLSLYLYVLNLVVSSKQSASFVLLILLISLMTFFPLLFTPHLLLHLLILIFTFSILLSPLSWTNMLPLKLSIVPPDLINLLLPLKSFLKNQNTPNLKQSIAEIGLPNPLLISE